MSLCEGAEIRSLMRMRNQSTVALKPGRKDGANTAPTVHVRARSTSRFGLPWVLMLISGLHVWNVIWWTGLFVFKGGYIYFLYMAVCWLVIELISIYFNPSATLRKHPPKKS